MYSSIISALETKLVNFASTKGYDVAIPDMGYTPTTNAYIESFILPAENGFGGLASGSYQDYQGIYQVNVVTPKGGGTADERVMVQAVLNEFSKASKAGIVLIEKSWASGSFERESSWRVVPVSIRYRLLA